MTLDVWHMETYGKRPALFTARFPSRCCWCGDSLMPGDEACYWPEHDASPAHAGCLRAMWKACA